MPKERADDKRETALIFVGADPDRMEAIEMASPAPASCFAHLAGSRSLKGDGWRAVRPEAGNAYPPDPEGAS